jgi:rubrerythrin
MRMDRIFKDERSRRSFFGLLGVGAGGGASAFIAACGGDDGGGDEAGDLEILNGALDLEHAAVAAYTEGVALLEGNVLKLGRQLLEHERQHVDGLSSAITELGGKPNEARKSYPFPDLQSEGDVLRFAHDLEQTAVAGYLDAIPKLSSAALRATAVQILTAEAEHISVLLDELGRPPVPSSFVKGATKVRL